MKAQYNSTYNEHPFIIIIVWYDGSSILCSHTIHIMYCTIKYILTKLITKKEFQIRVAYRTEHLQIGGWFSSTGCFLDTIHNFRDILLFLGGPLYPYFAVITMVLV